MTDKERIDWLEKHHTLHKTVEFLYVVDGYKIAMCFDYSPFFQCERETIRECIDVAMMVVP